MTRLLEARLVSDHLVWLRFNDGLEGEVDLSGELDGPIFAPLQDPDYFRRFVVNPDLHTLTWPNGADFAPEFLHDLVATSGALARHAS